MAVTAGSHATPALDEVAVADAPRLLGQHCQRCHGLEVIQRREHSRLGWYWTVQRMRWLHGAELEPEARAAIVGHLAARDAAGWGLRLSEAARLLGPPLGLLAVVVFTLLWKRKVSDVRDR
ncbi:MAG: hypothetical protein U5K43_13820 [Halofilum sp. (in: g-proteobacteria)]|nr:hypothetical protein [Halofilum sp. (in: g-proteobacteria)]